MIQKIVSYSHIPPWPKSHCHLVYNCPILSIVAGMFKVLDCWVDRGTLCSLCPRGYFLVTPTFDCKKCSCCCNGFAPQPECLEQGLPSSQACVRDLACECNDTIVVTAPTHTYHQPNATIRVTWPQDTPAAGESPLF